MNLTKKSNDNQMLFSWPYTDFVGMGEVLTLGYPVFRDEVLQGFVGIDTGAITR